MTANTFDLEQELLQTVRRLPATRAAEVLDFAQFLVTRYPAPANGGEQALDEWDKQVEQISHEQRAYQRQHGNLLAQYDGRYIAMRHGRVIDDDVDKIALSRRIRRQYGNQSVLIKLVQAEPMETYYVHSPKLARE